MKTISQQAALDQTSRMNVWRRLRDHRLTGRRLVDGRWVVVESATEAILLDALEPQPIHADA